VKCTVSGDVLEAGLVSLPQLRTSPLIEAIYTDDLSHSTDTNESRKLAGLQPIKITLTS
jgi:hypothetical protein